MQRALRLVFPDQCLLCPEPLDGPGALCPSCWRDMPFVTGHSCDLCGAPLPGEADGIADLCDECLELPRPWSRGRAALTYENSARRFVLGLKHGDRTDLVPTAARWMARAGADLLRDAPLLVPVPIQRGRLLRRRFNQSAELVRAIARLTGCDACTHALKRTRSAPSQDGLSADGRFANLEAAIGPDPRAGVQMEGRHVCLVDDVMVSGATLAAAAEASLAAGAGQVSVLVLARATRRS